MTLRKLLWLVRLRANWAWTVVSLALAVGIMHGAADRPLRDFVWVDRLPEDPHEAYRSYYFGHDQRKPCSAYKIERLDPPTTKADARPRPQQRVPSIRLLHGAQPEGPGLLMDRLIAAMEAQDAAAFEDALAGACLSPEMAPLLARALLLPWHRRHEDVARALQQLRDPRTVEALYAAALSQHDYLEYDGSAALARKCTWALADIRTPEARACLERLARADEPVAGYARKRLEALGT